MWKGKLCGWSGTVLLRKKIPPSGGKLNFLSSMFSCLYTGSLLWPVKALKIFQLYSLISVILTIAESGNLSL